MVDDTEWELLERPASRPQLVRLERTPVSDGPLFGTAGRAVRAAGFDLEASILYVEPQDTEAACEWDGAKEIYRARLRFTSGGNRYDLPLTDCRYARILRERGEGVYTLNQLGCRTPHGLRLVVTLGEPFHGWCYKMAAGILPRRTVELWRPATQSGYSATQTDVARVDCSSAAAPRSQE